MNEMNAPMRAYLTEKFSSFLSDERKASIEHVLSRRTKHIRVAVENLIDPHNVNAIFRSGECLGIQDFHVIDNEQSFHIGKGVSKGASKWIDIHRHNESEVDNSLEAIQHFKQIGYQLVVTSLEPHAMPLHAIDISRPLVLVCGNETGGVSKRMREHADQLVSIPMYGFTESYNVSVAAAIILYHMIERMHKEVENWQLNEQEKTDYKFQWYKKCMARPDYYQNYYVDAYKADQNV
ncbi:MAG: tRNA (guanosine-2'-O-)-methyltransferase [Marivirga sp.]|jgi:tRNA (guanosine-2'-O-)-methyltransferase